MPEFNMTDYMYRLGVSQRKRAEQRTREEMLEARRQGAVDFERKKQLMGLEAGLESRARERQYGHQAAMQEERLGQQEQQFYDKMQAEQDAQEDEYRFREYENELNRVQSWNLAAPGMVNRALKMYIPPKPPRGEEYTSQGMQLMNQAQQIAAEAAGNRTFNPRERAQAFGQASQMFTRGMNLRKRSMTPQEAVDQRVIKMPDGKEYIIQSDGTPKRELPEDHKKTPGYYTDQRAHETKLKQMDIDAKAAEKVEKAEEKERVGEEKELGKLQSEQQRERDAYIKKIVKEVQSEHLEKTGKEMNIIDAEFEAERVLRKEKPWLFVDIVPNQPTEKAIMKQPKSAYELSDAWINKQEAYLAELEAELEGR